MNECILFVLSTHAFIMDKNVTFFCLVEFFFYALCELQFTRLG